MLFWVFMLIIISVIPHETRPEFVVHEIEACCHHRITLTCGGAGRSHQQQRDMKIVVVQARYVIDQDEEIPAVPSSQPLYPFPNPTEKQFHEGKETGDDSFKSSAENVPFSKHPRTISLWDLDIKWMHDLTNENLPHPIPMDAPPWHPSHISTHQGKAPFMSRPRKVTTPPIFPSNGLNFTSSRVIEMPPYQMDFLDKNTIWREPLFSIGPTQSSILSGGSPTPMAPSTSKKEWVSHQLPSSRESRSESISAYFDMNNDLSSTKANAECWSYHALSSTSATYTTDPNKVKPPWHFKDLRAYFNQRCSGRNKCTVELLRGKQPDPDVTKLCHLLPEGKITVKYLCYNSSSDYVHSRCNVDVIPAKEGFVHNPGYPDLYPGDQPCQWRLHVPQQKILLLFFDISLRGKEKLTCRDELVTSEEHSKLLSTCGDHSSAVALLSESHQLNVTLIPQSRLAFPKRGFLIYYRVLGCRDPERPRNSYMAFRNATHAYLLCDLGHLYSDTLTRDRWIYCNPLEDKWTDTISHCQDVRSYSLVNGNISIAQVFLRNPSFWPVKHSRHSNDNVISDFILPISVMLGLFLVNGFVLFFIWKKRQRLEEMENERNQEMEEICAAVIDGSNTPVDESTFSFPSSAVEDLWHDHFDDDIDEMDQDRTLTTLTLHTTSSPPDSTMMRHYMDSHLNHDTSVGSRGHQSNGYYKISQDGSFTSFQQPRYPQTNGVAGSCSFVNGNGVYHHQAGHGATNGSLMPNGSGNLVGHTYYTGYSKTTAV